MDNFNGNREDLEARIIVKAMRDPQFKEELLRDPKGVIARESGTSLPAGVSVKVLEETPNTRYLVIPDVGFLPNLTELSSEMLASVAGGMAPPKTEQCTGKSWCC